MQLLRLRLGLLLMNRRKWWWACSLGSGLSKILSVILCFCCSTSVISPYCIDQVHFWHFNMTWIKQQDRIHCWLIERLLTGGRFITTRVCILRIWQLLSVTLWMLRVIMLYTMSFVWLYVLFLCAGVREDVNCKRRCSSIWKWGMWHAAAVAII